MRRFRDYYRQFEAMTPEEVSRELRARHEADKRRALSPIRRLDLSGTAWHEPPHAEAVNAATFALRRALHAYPPADGGPARAAVAARHGLAPAPWPSTTDAGASPCRAATAARAGPPSAGG